MPRAKARKKQKRKRTPAQLRKLRLKNLKKARAVRKANLRKASGRGRKASRRRKSSFERETIRHINLRRSQSRAIPKRYVTEAKRVQSVRVGEPYLIPPGSRVEQVSKSTALVTVPRGSTYDPGVRVRSTPDIFGSYPGGPFGPFQRV